MIVVAGPTASGKSALALALAEKVNGVIINADSMQVYRDVPTLTARPLPADEAGVEHCLYGFLEAHEKQTVFQWVKLAAAEIRRVWKNGQTPIVTGGTGFYLQTLMNGISPVPEVDPAVRESVRERFDSLGAEAFLEELRQNDPAFSFTDPQRMLRAAEIFQATGKSITYWQSLPFQKEIEADWLRLFIDPPRQELYKRCNLRFNQMMNLGAVEEVKELLAKNPPPDSLILKAVGVLEIKAFLKGQMSRNEAVSHAQQMTRNYAKRQVTWFKHRFFAHQIVSDAKSEMLLTKALHFLS